MNFFDTLKDYNVKNVFGVLAVDRFGKDGKPLRRILEDMTFEERVEVFTLTHNVLKSIGLVSCEPQYLERGKHPQYAVSDYYHDRDRNYPYEGPR